MKALYEVRDIESADSQILPVGIITGADLVALLPATPISK